MRLIKSLFWIIVRALSKLRYIMNSLTISLVASFLTIFSVHADKSIEQAFSEVYSESRWGKSENGEPSSGLGSILETTYIYRVFLQNFLHENRIQSVVDIGCGDWEFSKVLDWKDIEYDGYEVVPYLVQRNNALYANSHIRFHYGDGTVTYLPPADLLICKDVLQHLPNEDVQVFLTQFSKFKYCIIVNDLESEMDVQINSKISRGGFHPLDITQAPFNVNALKLFGYWVGGHYKQVFLIKNG